MLHVKMTNPEFIHGGTLLINAEFEVDGNPVEAQLTSQRDFDIDALTIINGEAGFITDGVMDVLRNSLRDYLQELLDDVAERF